VSIDLRAATASDEPFLFALYASTREHELAAWGWEPAQRDAFLRMQWMAQSHVRVPGVAAAATPGLKHCETMPRKHERPAS